MDGGRIKDGGDDDLALVIFESIGESDAITAGHFLTLDRNRILIPGGALKDGFTKAYYNIDILQEETDGLTARVSSSNRALSRDALLEGGSYYETVRCDKLNGEFSLCSSICTCGSDVSKLADDIVNACFNLDGALTIAMAYDSEDNPDLEEVALDSMRLFESFGFGKTASSVARVFDDEYCSPYDRALAAYALPYNLQKVAESGVLDAVIAECNGAFGLYKMTWRRWYFCSEIVAALQARGFTNEQIAYVICHDEDLFDAPETRRYAEALCEMIRESSFDPEDMERWSEYLATETGPLAGFL